MAKKKLTASEKREVERDLYERKEMGRRYINEPTILYEVGEHVEYGNHHNATISEVCNGGKFYKLFICGDYKRNSIMEYREYFSYVDWTEIGKYRTPEENSKIKQLKAVDNFRLIYQQRSMYDIFLKTYHYGLDTSPVYQREYVWEQSDKVDLIDSIFNNVDIGKFVFVKLPFKEDSLSYEILDGKQRIAAIIEFFENHFSYKGMFYKDLCHRDKHHFTDYCISYAEILDCPLNTKIQYFLNVNTSGKSVSVEHLNYVRSLITNE